MEAFIKRDIEKKTRTGGRSREQSRRCGAESGQRR
jgi:hypothetical protein